MVIYLNSQIKAMYNVTENDYLNWCKDNNYPTSYKETVSKFVYKLRTGRLVKVNGKLVVKRPRRK